MLFHEMNASKTEPTHLKDDISKTRQNLLTFLKERKGEGYWSVRRLS